MVLDERTESGVGGLVAPPAGGVRVWVFRATPEAAEAAQAFLLDEELSDIGRLAIEQDRLAALISRSSWRQAVGSMLGVCPRAVEIGRTPYGRPYPVGLERTVADLSTTHAGGLVGLAVGRGVRVGLDIEPTLGVQLDEHVGRAIETISGPAIELIQDRTERTLFAWCVLEALLKADGRGMHLSPSMVSAEIRTLWGWNSARVGGTAWWVRRFQTPAGSVGAIAASGPVLDIDFIDPV